MEVISNIVAFENVINKLKKEKRLSIDTETTGLDPYSGSRLFAIIIASDIEEYYLNYNNGGMQLLPTITPIASLLNSMGYLYFLNASFDILMMRASGIVIQKPTIIDAAVLARLEYNKHPDKNLSLDYLSKSYLKKAKNTEVENYIKAHSLYDENKNSKFYEVPLEIMSRYACMDARLTYDLCTKIISCINHKDREYRNPTPIMNVAKNESALIKALYEMKHSGIKLDRSYVEKAYKYEKRIEKLHESRVKKVAPELNLRSPKQVASFIMDQGGFLPKNENGNYITDVSTLEKLDLPVVQDIVKSKQAGKKATTYYKNFLDRVDKNDILHCNINQSAACTGRTSSSHPNLQNLHKEKWTGKEKYLVRHSFIPHENHTLFFFDYSQQEMIFMLDQSEEMSVINKVKAGMDFYEAAAETIKDLTDVSLTRYEAKQISLALAYGMGIKALADKLHTSEKRAKLFRDMYFKGLPRLQKLQADLQRSVRTLGRIVNPFGRVFYLNRSEAYKALNWYVQGSSADISKIALVKVHELLKSYKSFMSLMVHDEIIVNLHNDEKALVPEIVKAMQSAYDGKHLRLNVGIEYSEESWSRKREYEKNNM